MGFILGVYYCIVILFNGCIGMVIVMVNFNLVIYFVMFIFVFCLGGSNGMVMVIMLLVVGNFFY